jgi:predicted nucleotidyltransferase
MQFTEETKQQIFELCRKNKVKELSIFGSRARGDNREDSDYDLLVEFQPSARIGLIEYSRMQIDLSDLLGRKVDLVPKNGLKPLIKERVLAEAEPIYEG